MLWGSQPSVPVLAASQWFGRIAAGKFSDRVIAVFPWCGNDNGFSLVVDDDKAFVEIQLLDSDFFHTEQPFFAEGQMAELQEQLSLTFF